MSVAALDESDIACCVTDEIIANNISHNSANDTMTINNENFGRGLLDWSQLILTAVGFMANFLTFLTLVLNGKDFTPAISLLLKHQAAVDGVACIIAFMLLLQEPMWTTGHNWWDHFICHVWHSQFLYWTCVFLSGWNLGCIALERYLAVCRPLRHKYFAKKQICSIFVLFYVLCLVFNSLTLFQTDLRDGHCKSEYFFKAAHMNRVYQAYAYFVFLTQYALPCLLFFFFYRSVILTLRRRIKEHILPGSPTLHKATIQITKTAIIVTIIFILALGYDLWYYILGYSGVFEYKMNSPAQKIGVWFSCFNSAANPFVFMCLIPAFRQSLKNTCSCRRERPKHDYDPELSQPSSAVCNHSV